MDRSWVGVVCYWFPAAFYVNQQCRPCYTSGFTSSPYTPTPKSFLLRRKVRLEILANEDADVDKEIWSKSDHKCWQLPSEHDLEKGCWLKVQLRAGGPCESQQKVTRRHLHL